MIRIDKRISRCVSALYNAEKSQREVISMALTEKLSKKELERLLDKDHRFYEIAKMYGVSPGAVTK